MQLMKDVMFGLACTAVILTLSGCMGMTLETRPPIAPVEHIEKFTVAPIKNDLITRGIVHETVRSLKYEGHEAHDIDVMRDVLIAEGIEIEELTSADTEILAEILQTDAVLFVQVLGVGQLQNINGGMRPYLVEASLFDLSAGDIIWTKWVSELHDGSSGTVSPSVVDSSFLIRTGERIVEEIVPRRTYVWADRASQE